MFSRLKNVVYFKTHFLLVFVSFIYTIVQNVIDKLSNDTVETY